MSPKRSTAAVVGGGIAVLAILAFLYGMPTGRMARREALRIFRLAGNATGVYPLPDLALRMWGGDREHALQIEVYRSGRLVVSGSKTVERSLARDDADGLMELGRAALGDFNSHGCETERGRFNSELFLLVDGRRMGVVCRNASGRPGGFATKRLFAAIEHHVPGAFTE